ncbi:hypothetical protein [Priestia flexa]|uniref:Uncharacterized protein n=1 Tax=Priestia flexa TaxID=86664 RepID=A0ABU4J289_9BACI|nr:hypothetical protein [Priestia flexa]MDW8515098.1 hypothetical protein [Priestia flexa]
MKKGSLNGYWTSKEDKNRYVFVERVFKKGYVTGFSYLKVADGEVISSLKITHDELQEQYEKGLKR